MKKTILSICLIFIAISILDKGFCDENTSKIEEKIQKYVSTINNSEEKALWEELTNLKNVNANQLLLKLWKSPDKKTRLKAMSLYLMFNKNNEELAKPIMPVPELVY